MAHSLKSAGAKVDTLVVESGEQSKSVAEADRLWRKLLELGADRKTLIVAVGGGVVGDLAGFVAATYARGLPFAQVPTTLLAQVDSSVGGKVGINLPDAKNMVGAFWQPVGVLADTETLKTLPEREYRAGLAEVVKYGVILDAEFFARLERDAAALSAKQAKVLAPVIERCCRLKADVVEADEREETGHRAVLNYGHTFCHALEAATGYNTLLHGEGVSIGMMCTARLAQRLKRVDEQFVRSAAGTIGRTWVARRGSAGRSGAAALAHAARQEDRSGPAAVCAAHPAGARGDGGQHRHGRRSDCASRLSHTMPQRSCDL